MPYPVRKDSQQQIEYRESKQYLLENPLYLRYVCPPSQVTYHKVKVRVDFVKKELVEDIGTRTDVALQLVACAISLKLGEYKECYRRETKVVGIDVD